MPVFLDVHSFGTATEEELINAQNAPRDDLGVKVANILYNLEGGAIYCILDAPDKKAVEKHHSFLGLICDTSVDVPYSIEFSLGLGCVINMYSSNLFLLVILNYIVVEIVIGYLASDFELKGSFCQYTEV